MANPGELPPGYEGALGYHRGRKQALRQIAADAWNGRRCFDNARGQTQSFRRRENSCRGIREFVNVRTVWVDEMNPYAEISKVAESTIPKICLSCAGTVASFSRRIVATLTCIALAPVSVIKGFN